MVEEHEHTPHSKHHAHEHAPHEHEARGISKEHLDFVFGERRSGGRKENDLLVIGAALVVAAIVLIAVVWLTSSGVQSTISEIKSVEERNAEALLRLSGISVGGGVVDKTALGKKVVDYLNENFLKPQGASAVVKSVSEKNRLYVVSIGIVQDGQTVQTADVFVSPDGEMVLIGQAFDLTQELPKPSPSPSPNVTKTAKPEIKFFVMSFCPYGQQAEAGLKPVAALFGEKAVFEPHYVIYEKYAGGSADYCIANGSLCSMHGIKELNEDIRQICVFKYFKEKWWAYVDFVNNNCSLQDIDSCWKNAATAAGIDVNKIEDCQEKEGEALIKAEKELNDEFGVSGSPMVFINNVLYKGGRGPEHYKQAVCAAFITPPSECNQSLSTTAAASSGGCGG